MCMSYLQWPRLLIVTVWQGVATIYLVLSAFIEVLYRLLLELAVNDHHFPSTHQGQTPDTLEGVIFYVEKSYALYMQYQCVGFLSDTNVEHVSDNQNSC